MTFNPLRSALLGFSLLFPCALVSQAQVNPTFAFGFEGSLSNIPGYGTFNFASGNNLQTGTTSDYYRSPDFGWTIQGWSTYSPSAANWNQFNANYTGNGTPNVSYPSNGGTASTFADAYNVNRNYSPAGGNLPYATGLGSQFMDTWGKPNNGPTGSAAQMNLTFQATVNHNILLTLAFGGRDSNSQDTVAFYRILEGSNVLFSGSTNNTGLLPQPFEYWTPSSSGSFTSVLDETKRVNTTTAGVVQRDWEYYQIGAAGNLFQAQAGHIYQLQVMLPDEINFDMAINERGVTYQDITGLVPNPVPEPSTYGAIATGALAGLIALRRRKSARKSA